MEVGSCSLGNLQRWGAQYPHLPDSYLFGQLQDRKSPTYLQKFQSLHFVLKGAQPNQTHPSPFSTEMTFYTPRSSLCVQDLVHPGTLPHLQPWPRWLHSLCLPLTPLKPRTGTLLPLDVNAENESLWGEWNRIWWKLWKKHLDRNIRAVSQCFADLYLWFYVVLWTCGLLISNSDKRHTPKPNKINQKQTCSQFLLHHKVLIKVIQHDYTIIGPLELEAPSCYSPCEAVISLFSVQLKRPQSPQELSTLVRTTCRSLAPSQQPASCH